MPIFEYFCPKCHHEFEEVVFGNELPHCAHCGASNCEKLMSRPCIQRSAHAASAGASMGAPASGSSKCGGCSGGNCATCH